MPEETVRALNCDLVMKGGATSGVVYPGALQEIAGKFNLVGIGGTSAGALGAVVAAAAEYRRRREGSFEGFAALTDVAEELAKPNRLKTLFRPDPDTKKLFDLAMRFLEHKTTGVDKLGLVWRLRSKKSRQKFFNPIAANNFGLCSGTAPDPGGEGGALTTWLTELIDQIAGLPSGHHLTFRDLLEAPVPKGAAGQYVDPNRSIDLRMVTTCLTFNRPVEFPLSDKIFAFKPAELARYFPESVVQQMLVASSSAGDAKWPSEGASLLPDLDLPVVVAARLSLNFPVLFSMVPLWAINENRDEAALERVWFSDGGITSNFPVHRFDSIYPRWPTLALNFQELREGEQSQRKQLRNPDSYIYMNEDREDGVLDLWSSFERGDSVSSLLGLVGAIFSSAQNWHDNAYLKLPGFRDRVAEIWLAHDEGGLKLDMEKAQIDSLIAKGREAGKALCARYAELSPSKAMSWRGHRWTRFRAGMEALVEKVEELGESMGPDGLVEQELVELLSGVGVPPAYRFSSDEALVAAKEFAEAAAKLATLSQTSRKKPFGDGPRPMLEMGSRAPI